MDTSVPIHQRFQEAFLHCMQVIFNTQETLSEREVPQALLRAVSGLSQTFQELMIAWKDALPVFDAVSNHPKRETEDKSDPLSDHATEFARLMYPCMNAMWRTATLLEEFREEPATWEEDLEYWEDCIHQYVMVFAGGRELYKRYQQEGELLLSQDA